MKNTILKTLTVAMLVAPAVSFAGSRLDRVKSGVKSGFTTVKGFSNKALSAMNPTEVKTRMRTEKDADGNEIEVCETKRQIKRQKGSMRTLANAGRVAVIAAIATAVYKKRGAIKNGFNALVAKVKGFRPFKKGVAFGPMTETAAKVADAEAKLAEAKEADATAKKERKEAK